MDYIGSSRISINAFHRLCSGSLTQESIHGIGNHKQLCLTFSGEYIYIGLNFLEMELHFKKQHSPACRMHAYNINYFYHVSSDTGQARAVHIQGPTIQTYEGPQGPETKLLKSGTVPVEAYVNIGLSK